MVWCNADEMQMNMWGFLASFCLLDFLFVEYMSIFNLHPQRVMPLVLSNFSYHWRENSEKKGQTDMCFHKIIQDKKDEKSLG